MGYIIQNGQVQKAKRITNLAPNEKLAVVSQTAKQKAIKENILKRKSILFVNALSQIYSMH
jgi:hypothetical protein